MFTLGNVSSLVALAALGNSCLRRLAVRRKLEDACWYRSHAHCHRWHWHHGHAPGMQTEPQVEPATSVGVILPETGQFLLLCSLHNCNIVVKLVQECKFLRRILLPFYGNSSPGTTRFLGKRTVTSECSC